IGHVFPAILKFKGGKGVATSLGLILVIFPETFWICFIAFAIIFVTTHYVSLGSITCAVLFPLQVVIFTAAGLFNYPNAYSVEEAVIAVLIGLLVIWLHRSNIDRLLHGNENKVYLRKKKD
ncbi:MAG: glycerol-3-phosphate acyltransferase, partial [Lachnospiraceae bacterium]|nr:glycerol-3-phosphate acyltransferase [Lachnospiraceae bacterium]